ncbi:MAG: hypothetical protein EBT13_17945 [Rhodobacteraceae bacterium]|nr:hypothetical protein [Paracoccaceae bacterium]
MNSGLAVKIFDQIIEAQVISDRDTRPNSGKMIPAFGSERRQWPGFCHLLEIGNPHPQPNDSRVGALKYGFSAKLISVRVKAARFSI